LGLATIRSAALNQRFSGGSPFRSVTGESPDGLRSIAIQLSDAYPVRQTGYPVYPIAPYPIAYNQDTLNSQKQTTLDSQLMFVLWRSDRIGASDANIERTASDV
jgi:hypothetical protein